MMIIVITERRGFTCVFAHVRFGAKAAALSCLIIIQLLLASWTTVQAYEVPLNTVAQVYFSPAGGCTEAIVSEINRAKSTILVQAYSFTSKEIAQALVNAHKRGVAIQIILDKSQRSSKYSSVDFISNLGINTFIDSSHSIAHNKVMVIDNQTVITGSFNFTNAAEQSNAENILIIPSSELAQLYSSLWDEHRKHSKSYSR